MKLLLVGGGLANGLLAQRLAATRPDVSFSVLEAGAALGGNHTWSFHGSDVTTAQQVWLEPMITKSWQGHDVALPGVERRLGGSYHSIRAEDFHRVLSAELGDRVRLKCRVEEVGAQHVVLASGERMEADAVIDARALPFAGPAGYQKFLGQELVLEAPHGLTRPLLMDAQVEQLDGFRFIYALPWDDRRVLVEDTRYADTPAIDLAALREGITRWVAARGWRVSSVTREESAALSIPLGGEVPQADRPVIGVSAGFFHATTGYSLRFAARLAQTIAALPQLDARSLTVTLNRLARSHWQGQAFFRMLNRMLFRAAAPEARVKLFASFYGHPEPLISRFYAGELTQWDKLRALQRGAPTVPAMAAIRAAVGPLPPSP